MNGTFVGSIPAGRRIGFMSQSGALGIAVMNLAESLQIGLSSFVSIGNKADVSGQRPLELLGRRRTNERDPVVPGIVREPSAVRRSLSGHRAAEADRRREERTRSFGTRATASHTGALLAASRHHRRGAVPPARCHRHRHPRLPSRQDSYGHINEPRVVGLDRCAKLLVSETLLRLSSYWTNRSERDHNRVLEQFIP